LIYFDIVYHLDEKQKIYYPKNVLSERLCPEEMFFLYNLLGRECEVPDP
jgi:hypothetical protein